DRFEQIARRALTSYRPGPIDRLFKRTDSRRNELQERLGAAQHDDALIYHLAFEQYEKERAQAQRIRDRARRVLKGDAQRWHAVFESQNSLGNGLFGSYIGMHYVPPVIEACVHAYSLE